MPSEILDAGGVSRLHRRLRNDEAAALIGIRPTTLKIWRTKSKNPRYFKLEDANQSAVVYDEVDILARLGRHRFRSTGAFTLTVVDTRP